MYSKYFIKKSQNIFVDISQKKTMKYQQTAVANRKLTQ